MNSLLVFMDTHPILSFLLVSVICCTIVDAIRASKGN